MTTLGILSDTHGRSDSAEAAVGMLLEEGADLLIHLGDIGSTGVIDAMAAAHPVTGGQVEAHLVFGNCDYDARALTRYALDLGIAVHDPFGELYTDGQHIAFTHGHLPEVTRHLLADRPGYLLHGHTHRLSDTTQGPTRVINPGALFRASRLTTALLQPASGSLRVLEVASVAG